MPSTESQRLRRLSRHGSDAVLFQALESGMTWWYDGETQADAQGAVAYVAAGRSWIAVGQPLAPADAREGVARRFARAARHAGRRAVFIGVESLTPFGQFRTLALGVQPVLTPASWQEALRGSRALREQLRRARAKGVHVRLAEAEEVSPGAPLRADIDRLRREWLESRPLEAMGFLVAVEPFHAPREHLYVVAERHGKAVSFASAVPVYERGGWLLEDVLRSRNAPNGTTELMLDALMRALGDSWLTPGVTPLAGHVPWWLRAGRFISTPLYDFAGLERFRARLRPARWDPIWMVWDRGWAPAVVVDVLSAFARGRLLRFAWQSLVRHPNGPPWAVALPLVPWTVVLAALVVFQQAEMLAFSQRQLAFWVIFDAVLAWLLFHAARHPRVWRLAPLTLAASLDAVLSLRHFGATGLGVGAGTAAFRLLATAGPAIGSVALGWACFRAYRTR